MICPPLQLSLAAHAANLLSVFEGVRVIRREFVGLCCVGNAETGGAIVTGDFGNCLSALLPGE